MNISDLTPTESLINEWIYEWGQRNKITDDGITSFIVKNTVNYVIFRLNQKNKQDS